MRTSRKIIGVFIAALALVVLPTASAQAAPFTMSIDNAILDMGGISGVRAIDSELEPPDPPATLTGDLTGSTVNVPKAGFVFPTKSAEVSPGITADIDMEANEDITGTFDSATGKLVLDANLKATVAVLASECVISPIELQLSSDNASPYLGEEFAGGIEGNGVIGASWTSLPPVTGGGSCGVVSQLIGGAGGIAMSHGVHEFQTCETDPTNVRCDGPVEILPTVAPKITSTPPASTSADVAIFEFEKGDGETSPVTGFQCSLDGKAFEACDSGSKTYTGLAKGVNHTFQVKATNSSGEGPAANYTWEVTKPEECPDGMIGTPPNCHKAGGGGKPKLGALKVAPKRKAVRRGKAVKFTVKVKNVGKARAKKVRVCVKAPKRLVKVKKCVTKKNLAAGKSAKVKFRVKLKRKARKGTKIKLKFTANGPKLKKKQAKAVIRVR